MQAHEHLADRALARRIHRETLPGPIAGSAQPLELPNNRSARLLLPLPDSINEALAAQTLSRTSFLLSESSLNHVLGGDARVVGPRYPEGVISLHSPPPDQDILEGII